MPFLPSLPENTHLIKDVWPTYYSGVPELLAFIDQTMSRPSDVTIAQREIIFAYVSVLNDCPFCYNAHATFAEEYGASEAELEALYDRVNPTSDPRMVPVLAYTRKLTQDAHNVTKADVDAILAQGWSEQAMADIVYVVSMSNMMTRVVAGFGVAPQKEYFDKMRQANRKVDPDQRRAKDKANQGKPKYVNFVKGPKSKAA